MRKLPAPAPDTPTITELQAALSAAAADTPARWSRMSCPRMIRHCHRFIELYLGRVAVPWPTRLLARLLGPIFLRRTLGKSPTATPRNLTTLPALRAVAGDDPDFVRERELLLTALEEVAGLTGTCAHPLYGEMAADDVVALIRHHTAHHANQFGLLADGGEI